MRLLVVNPYASGVTEERIADVKAALGDVEVRRTEHAGHATDLVREHADAEAVYVFSGDGGFNEVLNGIGPETPVGFVPGGGANVLPRALGLPGDPVLAAEQLAKGRTRRISVGRVNGRRFAFSAGIGIDAEAVRRIEARGRAADGARAGNLVFAWELARLVATRRGRFDPALEILGQGRAAFALVANTDPYTYAGPVPVRVAQRPASSWGSTSWRRAQSRRSRFPGCSGTRYWAEGRPGRATSSTRTTSTGSRWSATRRCLCRPTARTSET